MLWIALYIPELSLQLAQRNCEAEGPLVIAAGPDNRPTVQYANQPAIDAGIKAGMTIASSRALVNDLHIVTRAPDAEVIAQWLSSTGISHVRRRSTDAISGMDICESQVSWLQRANVPDHRRYRNAYWRSATGTAGLAT